jgi:Ca2+-binding RTX toxin-like protein
LFGLAGDDTITAGSGSGLSFCDGGAGNDVLFGGGDDVLFGNIGDDELHGTLSDSLEGGVGNDTYFVDATTVLVIEGINKGVDTVVSTVTFNLGTGGGGIEALRLDGGDLDGTGNALNNIITGTDGVNALEGGIGNDVLFGFDGKDVLTGGADDDVLIGGDGADTLGGGAGNDVYLYKLEELGSLASLGNDFILGFEVGKDKVDVATLLLDLGIDTDDAIGLGFVSLQVSGGNTAIRIDADGSAGGAETPVAVATLIGVTTATVQDVIF